MVQILSTPSEPLNYRMQAVQSISVICHNSKILQLIFLSFGMEQVVAEMIMDQSLLQDMKYWL
jgi:hypothetical protein